MNDDGYRRSALRRALQPASIAIVGLSDGSAYVNALKETLTSVEEIFVVNPHYTSVLGKPSYSQLTDIGHPVDVVLSLMSATRSTDLVEEAALLDIGGVVIVAGGFAEVGSEGLLLQERIAVACSKSGMAVIGPNGMGYANVPSHVNLMAEPAHDRRAGGLSIVSHSGAMVTAIDVAAQSYAGCGFNFLISAGNEAVTDLADYVDFLAADPATAAIGLVIEQVRRPAEFFAAVQRAIESDKPVVALKLGRRGRSQEIAASHTGALTKDAWVYDVALKQAGVILASDPEELVDRLVLFDQLPKERWAPIDNLGIVTLTGGFASLSYDIAVTEGLSVPELKRLSSWISEKVPGITVPNPLDLTGLGRQVWPEVVSKYASSEELDALLFIHPLSDFNEVNHREVFTEFVRAATTSHKPFVATNTSGPPGNWVFEVSDGSVAFGKGVRPALRGLESLSRFVRYRSSPPTGRQFKSLPPRPKPTAWPEGISGLPSFEDTMRFLDQCGIPVAPYVVIPADGVLEGISIPFAGPYVAKLANVRHRTDANVVRLGISDEGLEAEIADLRGISSAQHLDSAIVVQPAIASFGEAFIGISTDSELGPVIAFGLGGIFVEVLDKISGRMAPFGREEALGLIDEFKELGIMHGLRGRPRWNLEGLAEILVNASELAAQTGAWISDLDINPMVCSTEGWCAVDAALSLR